MKQLPNNNLPDRSAPWARALEADLEATQATSAALSSELQAALSTITTLSDQNQTMQNYIRTLCALTGNTYPPAASPPAQPPAAVVPVAPTMRTKDFYTTWSATWYQNFKRTSAGGTNDDRQSLYQRGSGWTYSMWAFDIGEAKGKKIESAQMYLSNISTYYNSQFTAFLGTHAQVNEPAGRQGRENPFDVGWTAGEAKWVPLPGGFLTGISNGSIQGFTMGDTTGETRNFARFNGHGRGGAPVLRLTYAV